APLGPVPPGSFITATATTPLNGTSEFSACIRVPTPQELIRGIISDVEQLVASGELNPGQGNALNAKLRAAIQQIDRGNFVAARNQLNAFINQVNALVMSRRLTPAHGDHLKGAANAVLSLLSQ
ncbi:MAG TPA: hypothetical protein VFQ92_01285, partial [Blastocatellia bacterium]|nr:hypothetical protein [Blastocatellia bacterium]